MAIDNIIRTNGLGVGTHHPKGYIHVRKGCGDFLFLHFITPYRIHLDDRVYFREAGDCMVFSPNTHQHYGSNGMLPFGNDWLHISGPSVKPLLKHLQLPVDTLFSPLSSTFIHTELKEIGRELAQGMPNWELAVDLKVRSLLLELSRAIHQSANPRLPRRSEEMHDRLNRLRLDMQARCTEKWDLERMLNAVHMSRSKFIHFYNSLFGSSPIRDLITMRLDLAKNYLESSDLSIGQIADACGFSDMYYFCRQFKLKNGVSPGVYRKNIEEGTV